MKLGRCINVDSKEIGPDIFNPDAVKTRETNNIYFEYKQVRADTWTGPTFCVMIDSRVEEI